MLIPTFLYHKKVFNIEKNSRLYTINKCLLNKTLTKVLTVTASAGSGDNTLLEIP